ncbi:RPA-interacting protein-like [Vespa mandarinia]|uniref:RPA-interacting protein-like n=1 Tax=Vespa mandarinia TaxID=7446 RepID=UPI0016217363|nr:RPA-interacting protein-like [Vespa mandarinia]XP_046819802.1 RPA-interacting protein-like [Vespa crabro]XP_047348622.1 RPA-interacting protein-like [Vespa velutina]
MENTGLSPLLITKLRIKDTINKIKNKSPQLQEVLRQRCRRRMKERRKEIFNVRRLGLGDTSEKPEEDFQLDREMDEEEENWIYEEYERMLQDEIEWIESLVYDDRKKLICPVCQTGTMIEISESVYCKDCGFWPINCNDIRTLGNLIDNSVNNHSQHCTAVPGFTMVSENKGSVLYMTCEECSFLTCVI